MDHDQAQLLDVLADYHRLDRYGFTPPPIAEEPAPIHGPGRRSAPTRSASLPDGR